MKRLVLLILAFSSFQFALSQSASVSGQVKDTKGEPIPFAHVRIANTYQGTLTNLEGAFQLVIPISSTPTLLISCVGYDSRTIEVKPGENLQITLAEDLITLQEVVIVPRDYAKELVLSAIERIPQNYPTREEMIEGFIRETLSRDSLADSLHYISEAQTESSKASYEKSKSQDEVKLIKGRKLDVSKTDLGIRIYAGAHLPHRFDLVMRREGPLNPRKLDDYIYQVDDTVKYYDQPLLRVGYLSRDGLESGTISILQGSHAIVSIEQLQSKEKFKGSLKVNRRQYLRSVTNYDIHEDSLWRLNYIQYSTKFTNYNYKMFLNSMYTAHSFKPEQEKIQYADRIQFGDFLMEEVGEFDPNYWTNFNVTLPDQKFDKAYEEQPEENEKEAAVEEKKDFLYHIQRMEFGYSFGIQNTSMQAHSIAFAKDEINIDQTLTDQTFDQWVISATLTYKLTERSLVSYRSVRSLTDDRSRDYYFGYTYRQPLGKKARTAIAGSLGYNYTNFNRSLGQVPLVNNTNIGGKKIDAEHVDIYSSSNTHAVMSSFAFIYEKSNRLKFIVSADHFQNFGGKNGLFFREDQGLFRRKEVFLENGDEGLTISSDDPNFERNWGLNFGIILGF